MPVISRFYGMLVKMYFRDSEHNPPHIHIIYGDYIGVINLNTLEMEQGDLPVKAYRIAREWTQQNQAALLDMWNTGDIKELPPII